MPLERTHALGVSPLSYEKRGYFILEIFDAETAKRVKGIEVARTSPAGLLVQALYRMVEQKMREGSNGQST